MSDDWTKAISGDFTPMKDESEPEPEMPNKALIVVMHGEGILLWRECASYFDEFLEYESTCNGEYTKTLASADHTIESGTWVVDMVIESSRDYYGEVDAWIVMKNERPPTKEEWKAYQNGEWIWHEPKEPT